MWVGPDIPACPTERGDGDGAIGYVSVSSNRLVVINENIDPALLKFSLRFDGDRDQTSPPYEFDPIIDNRGGAHFQGDRQQGDGSIERIAVIGIAGVAILAAAAFFAIGRLRR